MKCTFLASRGRRRTAGRASAVASAWVLFCAAVVDAHAHRAAVCDVKPPDGWQQAVTRWDGPCRNGAADGLGVLKEIDGPKVRRLAFGRFEQGELRLGVIEEDGGFRAGRFQRGQVVPSEDRQTLIDAFNEGAKAADQVSARFKSVGNKASAGFYRHKAEALRSQMD